MRANRLSFDVRPFAGAARAIAPQIDGAPLTDMVAAFETAHGWTPAGGYQGIVPERFRFGSLDDYFSPAPQYLAWRPAPGRIWVLGCTCGEASCWPLECAVGRSGRHVVWSDFSQPHRPDRQYAGFGPFRFAPSQYARAVDELARPPLAASSTP